MILGPDQLISCHPNRWGYSLLTVFLTACSSPSELEDDSTRPVPCLSIKSVCTERVAVGSSVYLPVFTTHSLSEGNPQVTRGLIIVHGANRNADDYFQRGFQAAGAVGYQETTVVVAPYFQTSSDNPASNELFWSSSGWKRGHLSSTEGPRPRRSSYSAIDQIVDLLSDPSRFPALTEITMTGHSAGGQVAHRYAATSRAEENLGSVTMRYVVANPSTYLYIRQERENTGAFVVPDASACSDYDEWHYGLSERNTYAGSLVVDTIKAQLVRRDVRILIGDADSLSASLDVSCGANLQGPYRFTRGRRLMRFMDQFFPEHSHKEMVVPSVGHSSSGMYLSAVGLDALFGT